MVRPLSSTRFARRDQPNVRAAPRIDDNQQSFKRIEADRDPPLFVFRILVADRDGRVVVEHRHRVCE